MKDKDTLVSEWLLDEEDVIRIRELGSSVTRSCILLWCVRLVNSVVSRARVGLPQTLCVRVLSLSSFCSYFYVGSADHHTW